MGWHISLEDLHKYIKERDNYKCVYCGDIGEVYDHVVPEGLKGKTIPSNLVYCCSKCNYAKLGFLTEEWLFVGFNHLLSKGESLEWLTPDVINEIQKQALVQNAKRPLRSTFHGRPTAQEHVKSTLIGYVEQQEIINQLLEPSTPLNQIKKIIKPLHL